ncbi:murein hydrolase effector protein LrgB [Methylocystis bryophila]|uniref:Murein hydrolase effector protein LrgB n=1 Tax=Methylocystis bryophila TaxID=655015 RepID=A0A1W6N1G4_9HYPH|nr:murein hydrolase effector protein LrgB [Methylocystis bryophila]
MALFHNAIAQAVFWSLLTIGFYLAVKRLYRLWPRLWLTPIAAAPAPLAIAMLSLHSSYHDYIRGTGWLVSLLGPATVAFAAPIYRQRELIRRRWPVLVAGVLAGSVTALVTSWQLASLLDLDATTRLSLLPRSTSTPFALAVAKDIGALPDLTTVFVIVTGLSGAFIGEAILSRLPIQSALARGSALGMSAHGIGTAKAHELGSEEGSIAGLVMVFAGVCNVIAAPTLVNFLR